MQFRIPVLSLGSLVICGSGCGAPQTTGAEAEPTIQEANAALLDSIAEEGMLSLFEGSAYVPAGGLADDSWLYDDAGALGVSSGLDPYWTGSGTTEQLSGLGVGSLGGGDPYDASAAYDVLGYGVPGTTPVSPEDALALQMAASTFCPLYADCVYDETPEDIESYLTLCKEDALMAAEYGTPDCAPALTAFFACVSRSPLCLDVGEIPPPPYLPYYRIVGCTSERDRARTECRLTE